ncbi:hypothetical protein [Pedobacter sp.]|uniref:hypothetical protein n=1 Tax=Pedobacter sp. TaxID=1411316 RepID=UPI003C64EBBE
MANETEWHQLKLNVMQAKNLTHGQLRIEKNLTKKVIDMHQLGYDLDFQKSSSGLLCTQTGSSFNWNELTVQEIEHFFKPGRDLRMYSVETVIGTRGIFISNAKFPVIKRKNTLG